MHDYRTICFPLGYDRFPKKASCGTIHSHLARPDNLNDLLSFKLHQYWRARSRAEGWTSDSERLRREIDGICITQDYRGLWVDARGYLVDRVGQSFLYDVPLNERGKLAEFATKRIRVICTNTATGKRFIRIGAIGDASQKRELHRNNKLSPRVGRTDLPRLLREEELSRTPHVLARFHGIWNGAGGMARAFNRNLRFRAASWYARRIEKWTGAWPAGWHEFVVEYGPTDEFQIRTPIGNQQGFCEIELHYETHLDGADLGSGEEVFGRNWCAFSIDDLVAERKAAISADL